MAAENHFLPPVLPPCSATPVKGFTPERLTSVSLPTGGWFPGDRMFAVEDGLGLRPRRARTSAQAEFTV
jgi:uncharacterized protein YcbX